MKRYSKMFVFQITTKKECSAYAITRNKVKVIAWANIILQSLFPLMLSFAPAIASAPSTAIVNVSTEPYIMASGENIATVAKKHGLTVDELKQINIYRTFSKPFNTLTSGDEIDVPRKASPFSIDNQKNKNADVPLENKLAGYAQTGAPILAAGNLDKYGEQMVRSAVNNEINAQGQHWLSQLGTARVQVNINEDNKLVVSNADVFVPLYDNQKTLLFTQLGVRNQDSRNTVNVGAGVRTFKNDWMVGANTFFDNDITGKNRRVGVGAEAWTDYLKLSANSYFRMTNWHQSLDFADYNERPANGYDARADAYLPAHPQLGGSLKYEKYRGHEVALFGKDNRQKNPHAVTAGISYTPIPLVTIGTEHRANKGSKNTHNVNLQLNLRLCQPWKSHFSASDAALNRTLAGSRYDFVERNNTILLDYQKQELIKLALPGQVTGSARNIVKVDAQVTTKYGLKNIEWDTASITAAGGEVIQTSSQNISIKLPPYTAGSNNYTLSAVAYDNQGNASNRGTTQIIITEQVVDNINATYAVSHPELPADGNSVSEITLNLQDANKLPAEGFSKKLAFALAFSPVNNAITPRSKPRSTPSLNTLLSSVIETKPGVYVFSLKAGLAPGTMTITPTLNDISLPSLGITLTEVKPISISIYRNGQVLTGHPLVGDVLNAVSACSEASNNCNTKNVYEWQIQKEVGGTDFTPIDKATSDTFTVTRDLQKLSIRVVLKDK
jgi:adhesin/invasin